jgi:hypothetical protein
MSKVWNVDDRIEVGGWGLLDVEKTPKRFTEGRHHSFIFAFGNFSCLAFAVYESPQNMIDMLRLLLSIKASLNLAFFEI